MTAVLLRKLLRDVRWPLLLVALILFAFYAIWVKVTQRITIELWPVFQGLADAQNLGNNFINDKVFRGPGKLIQTMMGGENINFSRAMDMLAIGYIHPLIQVIFCIWAIGRAAGAIAGEIDRGTMELLLAQPLARSQLILAHLLIDLLTIPLLCLSMIAGTYFGFWVVGPFEVDPAQTASLPFRVSVRPETLAIEPAALWPALLVVAGLVFALTGATLWLSAAGRSRTRVMGIATLVVLLMFLVNLLGQLWDVVAFLRPFTIFYYYQPQLIVLREQWSISLADAWGVWATGLTVPMLPLLYGIGTVGYIGAWVTFVRRDVPAPL